MSSNQGDVANTFRTFCQMLRYMSLDNACDAVSSLSRGFADLRIPARASALLRLAQHLDQRARRAQEAAVVAGRADELHPERKGTLAREQRQRQGRLPYARSLRSASLGSPRATRGEVVRHLRRHDEPSEDELTDV
jgi:hypothetical protein